MAVGVGRPLLIVCAVLVVNVEGWMIEPTTNLPSPTFNVRLADGKNKLEGRVELFNDGEWGTVCDDSFDSNEAAVICRQLGNYATRSSNSAKCCGAYGPGIGEVFLDNVQCTGFENKLDECRHNGFKNHNCNHNEDAGVVCTDVRVVGSTFASASEGYIEIVNNRTWGKICADGWDINDASVICRQLFNTSAVRAFELDLDDFGGEVITTNMACNGDEAMFTDCPHGPWQSTCPSNKIAAVECVGATKIRLVNGNNHLEGRVELFYNGQWGTICDDGWDFFDAVVACRHLGNYAVKQSNSAKCCAVYGTGTGVIHLDNLSCTGVENRIEDCVHSGWGTHNCGHHEDSGVECTDIRISQGNLTSDWDGVIETLHEGQWGNICFEDFDENAAKVFCYQLHMTEPAQYGSVPQESAVFMKGLKCSGNETILANCTVASWGNFTCTSGRVATIQCRESGNIRLKDGVNEGEGRLEIFYSGTWGTVCDDDFGTEEANVVCRQLGYRGANQDTPVRKFGQGTGAIHLDNLLCTGAESRLDECRHPDWGDHNCGHHEDAGVVCDTSDGIEVNATVPTTGGFIPTPSTDISEHCRDPLGMENRNIDDIRISASSFASPLYAPSKARLNLDVPGGSGVAWKPVFSTSMQWIKVDLRVPHIVSGIQTQGRNRSGEYVRQFRLQYSQDGNTWADVRKSSTSMVFVGNTDDNSVVTNYFNKPVMGRFIRMNSMTWRGQISLRFELLGCGECSNRHDGSDYRGSVNTTITGKTCQRWTSQYPHQHERTPERYPNGGLGDHNFCRNPDQYTNAWCYTTDPDARYEICDIGAPGEYCGNEELLVRLANGNNALEGRVEIFHDGEWGTICDDSFGITDAKVICTMLGYQGTDSSQCCKSFGPGSGNIILDDLACLGTEDSIELCRHNGWGKHNCRHEEDVGVICKRPIRIVGGATELIGRVEVFHNNEWGTICNRGYDINDARVICSMMGGYNVKRITLRSDEIPPKSDGPILVSNLGCNGTEGTLDDCKHDQWGGFTSCSHDQDIMIECERGLPVRLVDGPNPLEGRVEVYHSGEWGTVCDDGWDYNDAVVVCRQLGGYLPKTLKASRCCGAYGSGIGPIMLDGVQCTGSEDNLHDCTHLGWTTHNCNHNEDAGVMCTDIRLRSDNENTDSMSGIVDVLQNGDWTGVCIKGFNMTAASIVCSQLFNTTATSYSGVPRANYPTNIRNIECTGAESTLTNCAYTNGTCDSDTIVKVECAEVRLVNNGEDEIGGRVEVLVGGRWGGICGNGWDIDAAKVACREVGFCAARSAVKGEFPSLTELVWNTVKCSGSETHLRECNKRLGPSPCRQADEAGVYCRRACMYPGDICNGDVTPKEDEYELEDTLKITCNDGFELIGADTLTCTDDCQWDNPLPTCKTIICYKPPEISFAKVRSVDTSHPFSSVVFYDCQDGYEDNSKTRGYMICSAGGVWKGQPPSCQQIKPAPTTKTPAVTKKTEKVTEKVTEKKPPNVDTYRGENNGSDNSAVVVGLVIIVIVLILFIIIVAAILIIRKKNERNRLPRSYINKDHGVNLPDMNHDKDDTPFCNYEFQNNDESDSAVLGGL
ncbi:scavenger receptor cysteine-rich domain superfamily protein-like [Antedon mediterranea]|uniref:scavenger receptor cysteine-rich domain superfamily protein-like n=1 Tax=Antedon mediterranea TaxID=105859 RepID=UPI003AF4B18B